ncbi:MAG: glutathione S-transferase family protein [Proteobacteria bacterium]|nr:glutathione S-transferase family protein [Pseudomonadota bacterium]
MILRGWPVSPYTAKTRAYLRFCELEFTERQPTAFGLYFRVQKKVGKMVMPTLELDDGRWLQDTSDIADFFENRDPKVTPEAPLNRFLSALFELFGDEWLIICAMQARWRTPGNPEFAIAEFGRTGFPGLPGRVQRRLARPLAERMQAHLPRMGLTPAMGTAFDQMLDQWLADLDVHLEKRDYLLGGRPCLGDFACMGPIYAHVWRDPASRHRVEAHPRVLAWMNRVHEGEPASGDWAAEVPATLIPLLAPVFTQMLPWIRTVVDAVNAWCAEHPGSKRVPRALGNAAFSVGDTNGERVMVTFAHWMAQRPLAVANEPSVQAWLSEHGWHEAVNSIELRHPMVRRDYREWLETTC